MKKVKDQVNVWYGMDEKTKTRAIEEIREYQNLIEEAEYYAGKDNELRLAKYAEANKMKIRQKYTSAQIKEASRIQIPA